MESKICVKCNNKILMHEVVKTQCSHILHKVCFEAMVFEDEKREGYVKCPECQKRVEDEEIDRNLSPKAIEKLKI